MSAFPVAVQIYISPLPAAPPGGVPARPRPARGLAPPRAMHPAPSLMEAYPNTKAEDQGPQHHPPQPQPPPAEYSQDHQDHQYDHAQQPPQPPPPPPPPPPAPLARPPPPPPPPPPQPSAPFNLQSVLQHRVTPPRQPQGQQDTGLPTSTPPISPPTVASPFGHDASPVDTAYSAESSQSIVFSAKDGAEVSSPRRNSRRRTGPLTPESREKAALIRRVGACPTCRKKRIACHPNHKNLPDWDVARSKYGSKGPMHEPVPGVVGLAISPRPTPNAGVGHTYARDPHEMDVDPTPHVADAAPAAPAATATMAATAAAALAATVSPAPVPMPLRLPLPRQMTGGSAPRGEPGGVVHLRTPLPAGPRLDRAAGGAHAHAHALAHASASPSLAAALSGPPRGRYTAAAALLVSWEDDADWRVQEGVAGLARVLEQGYGYRVEHIRIPTASSPTAPGGCRSSARWLQSALIDFIDRDDARDVLKLVYYTGGSLADEGGKMVLASMRDRATMSSTIRWGSLWETLEGACSDTLVLLDAPYYPPTRSLRQKGVLEVIAAAGSEDQYKAADRGHFTRLLTAELRPRTNADAAPLSAAELHTRLVAHYRPDGAASRFGPRLASPLLMQFAGNWRVPSVTLYPLDKARRPGSQENPGAGGPRLGLTIRLAGEATPSQEAWADWLRMMPDGIKDVQLQENLHWLLD